MHDEIWKLGARVLTTTCLDAGNEVPSWSASEKDSSVVPVIYPGILYHFYRACNLPDNVLKFESQILHDGAGYTNDYDRTGTCDDVRPSTSFSIINTKLSPVTTVTLARTYLCKWYVHDERTFYGVSFKSARYTIEIRISATAGNIMLFTDGQQVHPPKWDSRTPISLSTATRHVVKVRSASMAGKIVHSSCVCDVTVVSL
ncbi:putative hydrolyze alpha-1 [Phytophthora infestans]|uniref:Putative hydrolyze alpha-1 n=1 Tax=Phytophthora infestans TaxID=4787 RepID=A0A833S3P1_PHYIN|nr:putative hydrolyze alpha-1 [Phytophthora infestans]